MTHFQSCCHHSFKILMSALFLLSNRKKIAQKMLLGISTMFAYSVMKNNSKINKQTNKQSIKSEKKNNTKKIIVSNHVFLIWRKPLDLVGFGNFQRKLWSHSLTLAPNPPNSKITSKPDWKYIYLKSTKLFTKVFLNLLNGNKTPVHTLLHFLLTWC